MCGISGFIGNFKAVIETKEGDKEIEFGVGIHGEPGIARQEMRTADELAADCLDRVLAEQTVNEGDEFALMINGFGGTPLQELYVLNNSVSKIFLSQQNY